MARRLAHAFERGSGHGLLQLGATEVGGVLPPVHAYWRDFAARYVTAVCTTPDFGEHGEDRNTVRVKIAPPDDLDARVANAPPMTGIDYLTPAVLRALWFELDAAFRVELDESALPLQDFLRERNAAWHLVGRVHFNLAENRADVQAPFAFLATYTARLGAHGKAQHLPLGQALREYAGAKNRQRLLSLLVPVQRSAASSESEG